MGRPVFQLKWFQSLRSGSRARRSAYWKRSVHASTWAFQCAGQRSHWASDGVL